jgi:hypothetical protein
LRPIGQLQAIAVGKAQTQGQAQQGLRRVQAYGAHQVQGFAVGAQQDVLAIVQGGRAAVGHERVGTGR